MEKQILEIHGKEITIMEQPASFALNLERKYGHKKGLVEYCREVLKYPAGANPTLEELINIPENVKYGDLSLPLIKDGKKDLQAALSLFLSLYGVNGEVNTAYVGETYLQALGKDINGYKFSEIRKIGEEVFKQVGEIALLAEIRETFRRM